MTRWIRRAIAASALFALFAVALTAHLFVWPATGAPRHADAIVMFNGDGARLSEALTLAWSHVAPNLVVSRGSTQWGHGDTCAPHIPGVTVTCFDPTPATTQGEAEFAGRLAARGHWHTVIVVATRPQATRARLRMERCFPGRVYVAVAPLPRSQWPMAIVYELGATVKAVVVQRGC